MPSRRQVVQGISALPLPFVVETVSPGTLTGSFAHAQTVSDTEAPPSVEHAPGGNLSVEHASGEAS